MPAVRTQGFKQYKSSCVSFKASLYSDVHGVILCIVDGQYM